MIRPLFIFAFISVSASFAWAQFSVEASIKKIDSTIDWIWDGGRQPTGNGSYFYGDRIAFYNASSTNGADRSFGYFLQYTYDMYCQSRGKPLFCAGRDLVVHFRIEGPNVSNKEMFVLVDGEAVTTAYFQQVRDFFFRRLEALYGKSPISYADRKLIMPTPKRIANVEFLVMRDGQGRGNNIWFETTFANDMLKRLGAELDGAVTFKNLGVKAVHSDKYYNYSQDQLLDVYDNQGKTDRITAVVASQTARDSYGKAEVKSSSTPIFIMGYCSNYPAYKSYPPGEDKDLKCTGVGIFLHELGHQMNLKHCTSDPSKVCTDNLATTDAGTNYLINYLSSKTKAMKVIYDY